MKTEYKIISAGTAIALIGFLPEIYAVVRALRLHLFLVGLVIVLVGFGALLRYYSEFDLA
ncbi:hypothetical protein [Natronorubrum sp. FCH18a]|uniref:hypothetical protein n=1 Tax=Natronorubrum sp. FCH18a TaxID=3447018 RepID=UPI003F515A36